MNPDLYFLKPVAECVSFIALILIAAKPIGLYLFSSLEGTPSRLTALLRPLERLFRRAAGARFLEEQGWVQYGKSLLVFNALGIGFLLLLELIQKWLPLNPQRLGNVPLDLAFNTAVSFGTNTNWQSYVPERTMSHLTQMLGLAVQNFLSAATGIAVALALIRGFIRKEAKSIGNFWVDLSRSIVYVLLPLSLLLSMVLLWQGAPQNFRPAVEATTLEGKTQVIPQGPVASQEAIKELGTNGGGFFNANSSHPYENPTPLTNLLELLAILLVPAGMIYAFGKMTGDIRQGRALMKAVLDIKDAHWRGLDVLWGRSAPSGKSSPGSSRRVIRSTNPEATWRAKRSASGSPPLLSSRHRRQPPPAAPSTTCIPAWPRCRGLWLSSTCSSEKSSSAASGRASIC